jgi:hypothetical protein
MGKGELDLLRQGFILGHASRLKRILKHTTPDRIKKGFSYREMYKYLAQEAFLKEVKFGDFSQMGDIELAIEKYKIPGLQIVSVLPKAKVVACPKQKPLVRVIERPPTHRPVKKVRHICKPKPKTKVVVRKPCYRKHYPERHKPCVPPRLRDEG